MEKTVVELFAGVGGFRVGLNDIKAFNEKGRAIEKGPWKFVWSNQWEPSTKTQHAFDCYNLHFAGDNNSNMDISKVNKEDIPDHTLLTGGFPCQDYSVAHTLSKAKGIEGKKGVLWWQINEILKVKRPPFVLLENVDRLIKSPAKQRGRDFGIMLRCFSELGYAVEWRVINAADYGFSQRRRRIYIFAFHKNTSYYKEIEKLSPYKIISHDGLFTKAFPIEKFDEKLIKANNIFKKYKDLVELSDNFHASFENSGYLIGEETFTVRITPKTYVPITLGDLVEKDDVDAHYFLSDAQKKKYEFLRGAKKIQRTDVNGHEYFYSEGSMSPYDILSLPARTMLTSEGTTNRSTHIILDPKENKLRILTPVECERINQFPDNWTNSGMPEKRRYFMMGNALVCGIIKELSKNLKKIISKEC
ncbi:MAG: DNA (cytosine-5-)-methyltransferase [Candidatus Shapirobacteria bacterium]|nr:DNA (cytosine-5-)-methyltransferase [Candidatus Shapirobacteria bacterium]